MYRSGHPRIRQYRWFCGEEFFLLNNLLYFFSTRLYDVIQNEYSDADIRLVGVEEESSSKQLQCRTSKPKTHSQAARRCRKWDSQMTVYRLIEDNIEI